MPKKSKKKNLKKLADLESRINKLEYDYHEQNTKSIKESTNNINWNFWGPTLISILAIIVSVFSILNDRIIASKSGEFNKGDFELYLGNFKLDSNKKSVIIAVNEIENIDVLLMGIPYAIYNSGKAKIENCNITISYPKANGKIAVDTEKYFIPKEVPINLSRKYYEEDFFDLIRYDIEKIQPTETIKFNELSVFRNSSISSSVEVFDKDSIPLVVSYKGEIAYKSILNIKSDKLSSLNYLIDYHHFNLKKWNEINHSDFINEYVQNENIDLYILKEAESEQKIIEEVGTLTISNFKSDKILRNK